MNTTIAVAAVTYNRHQDLATLLDALEAQAAPIASVHLVDSGTESAESIVAAAPGNITYLRSERNLGGAGGFSFAILSALASGAEWVWIMDDDAHPEDPQVLARLLEAANQRRLDVVVPLIVAPTDPRKLSFPFRIDGHLTHDRAAVEAKGFISNIGQFFNGALIRSEVFFRVGIPDVKMFIRGDETDFMLRLRKAGIPFGTVTTVALSHPPGWAEVKEVLGDRLHVLVPQDDFKKFYFYRNRGYLTRKYRRVRSLAADLVGYPLYFLTRRDLRGFSQWFSAYWSGIRGRKFGPPDEFGF